MNATQVQELLRREVLNAGGCSAWAALKGVDQGSVSRALNGAKPPRPAVLAALGVEQVLTYRKRKDSTT